MTDPRRRRRAGLRRTLAAAGALFGAVLVLLGAQLALGRDPALQQRTAPAGQTASTQRSGDETSVVDTILGLARSTLLDDEGGDDDGGGAPPVQTGTS